MRWGATKRPPKRPGPEAVRVPAAGGRGAKVRLDQLLVERGLAIVTGLVPLIGYDRAAAIAHTAAETGKTVREVAEAETDLTPEQLDAGLDPFKMTRPG